MHKCYFHILPAVSLTRWSKPRPVSCLTCVRGWGRVVGCATFWLSTWETPPRPLKSCCAQMTSITTWVRASETSSPRASHSLRESAPKSAAVSETCILTNIHLSVFFCNKNNTINYFITLQGITLKSQMTNQAMSCSQYGESAKHFDHTLSL